MNLRPEVQAFAEMMEARLRVNDHKGGWQNDSRAVLLARMYANLPELPSLEACVDVANYALMLALPGSYAAPAPSAPADQPSPDKQGQQGEVAPCCPPGEPHSIFCPREGLAASPAPTEEPRTDGVGAREEPWRKCLFCGCNTNARVRDCCEKGRRADLNAVCASRTDGATEEPIAPQSKQGAA